MINKFLLQFKKAARGFTIIETLVAILILTTAIAGPLTIAAKGLTTAIEARDQLTAFYLAQDAIEYVRYARDTNTLSGDDWLTGSGGSTGVDLTPCETSKGCKLNSLGQSADNGPGDPSVIACDPSLGCPTLLYETSSGNYDYNASTGTSVGTPSFVRTVKLTPVSGAPAEVTVLVTVSWHEPNLVRTITVQEDLFNWQ